MRRVRFDVGDETVAGEVHEPAATPRGGIVLVHGLLSQRGEFAETAPALASLGWRVLAFDQRGFGESGGARGIITQERATRDVLEAVAFLRREAERLPVGLVGHSMGAVFTLRALEADPTIGAAVLGAPMRTVRAELGDVEFQQYRLAHAVSRVKDRIGLGALLVPYKNRYKDLFHDPDARARAEKAGFLSKSVSLANYDAFMAMDSEAVARKVRQPVMVLLAKYDRAVREASSRAVYDALGGNKEVVTLASGHSLFGDGEAPRAVAEVDRWMRANLRGSE